ncbi:MAG: hypothetical protein R3B71_02615 [Candidatus Gracilibacteria bacterium]|nr:hypothetical protein [Candidatus Peregrinibacteria bacterium]
MKDRVLAVIGLIIIVGIVLLAYFLGNNDQFQGYLHVKYQADQGIETPSE